MPVEIDLRCAWDGALQAVAEPYLYNPYLGCQVHFADWFGDRFVLLYREKHDMMLCAYDPPYGRRPGAADDDDHESPDGDGQTRGPETSERIEDSMAVSSSAVWFLADRGTLLLGRALPSLARTLAVLPPENDGYPLFWIDEEGRARVAECPQWSPETETWAVALERARAASTTFALPRLDVADLHSRALAARCCRSPGSAGR